MEYWQLLQFAARLQYVQGDFMNPETFTALKKQLDVFENNHPRKGTRIFSYLFGRPIVGKNECGKVFRPPLFQALPATFLNARDCGSWPASIVANGRKLYCLIPTTMHDTLCCNCSLRLTGACRTPSRSIP